MPLTDENLLSRINERDEGAYEELYRRHYRRLVRRFCAAGDEAEDLAQEVMLRVFRSVHSFLDADAKAWINGIARHVFFNFLNRRRLEYPLPVYTDEDGESLTPDFPNVSNRPSDEKLDANDLLISAMHSLPWAERSAILLTLVMGLPLRTAAVVMDVRVESLRQYRTRAYSRIRQFLSGALRTQKDGVPLPVAKSEPNRKAPAYRNRGQKMSWAAAGLFDLTTQPMNSDFLAAAPPQSIRDRRMSPQQRNARVKGLLRTLLDRENLPHRAQRFSSEIAAQRELLGLWMRELIEMAEESTSMEGQHFERARIA